MSASIAFLLGCAVGFCVCGFISDYFLREFVKITDQAIENNKRLNVEIAELRKASGDRWANVDNTRKETK